MLRKKFPYLLTAIVVGVAFFLLKAYHFSLVHYFLLTAAYIALMCRISGQYIEGRNVSNNSYYMAILAYLGTALLSVMVYVNYHQARGDVYSNTDHHALALKGYQLPATSTFFGTQPDALFQDSTAMGQLTCELIRNDSDRVDSIILRGSNFMRTLYVRRLSTEPPHTLEGTAINQNNTLPQIGPDGLRFQNDQLHRQLQVQIIEKEINGGLLSQGADTAYYVFTVTDSTGTQVSRDTSDYHIFIQKSYALSTLIPAQTVSEFGNDLDGYHITRSHYLNAERAMRLGNYPLLSRLLRKSRLKSFRSHQYLLEQVRPNTVARLLSDTAEGSHACTVGLRPGERVYIGFGNTGTQPMQFNEHGQLLFDLPKYQPLPDEQEQTEVFVTSSSNAISQPENLSPYNILFELDQLEATREQRGNLNIFTAKMAFDRGSTRDSLLLLVNRRQLVRAGHDFTLPTMGQARAILQLTDFKSTSLYQPAPFARTILWLFIVACVMVALTRPPICIYKKSLETPRFLRIAPAAEMACVVLLMVLFTTRFILCWRLSAFPPLENVSLLEYESFIHNTSLFNHLTRLLPLAFLGCMLVKLAIYIIWKYRIERQQQLIDNMLYNADEENSRWYTTIRARRWLMWLPAGFLLLESILYIVLPRGFQILIPVGFYFLVEILLVHIFVGRESNGGNVFHSLLSPLGFPFVFNYFCHLALLTIFDAGFGVMFVLFGVMRAYMVYVRYLNYDIEYGTKEYRFISRRWLWMLIVAAFLFLILVLFFFAPNMMAFLMNNAWAGNIFLIIALSLGMSLFLWGCYEMKHIGGVVPAGDEPDYEFFDTEQSNGSILQRLHDSLRHTRLAVLVGGIVVFATAFVLTSGIYDKVLGPDGHYTHIRYRTKVLVEDWDRTLNNERVSDDKRITRFRQTSENQWILDHYYTNRPRANDPYFRRQPMSKTGAMWGAQTTDLSFLRFGIGEHGIAYAASLLLLMLVVFAIAFRQSKNPAEQRREARRGIATAALLLLLMQGIFVWMSVTNKFIFFGQDFPMLSITSKMTIFYVLFLLALTCWLSWPEYEEQAQPFNHVERQFSLVFTGVLLVFCVVVHFFVGENRKNKNVDAYLLKLDRVENVLYAHNRLFRFYQLRANEEYNKLILSNNQGRNFWGKRLFQDFNKNIYSGGEEAEKESPDCIILDKGTKLPWVPGSSQLYQPLKYLFDGQKHSRGAYFAMSADSVTLEIRLPEQNTELQPADREMLDNINLWFYDYQIENRSLKMARLGKKGNKLRTANDKELASNRQILETGNATAFVADYLEFVDQARHNIDAKRDTTLKRLIDGIDSREVTGATFTNSLIEAYLSTYSKSNSPANIIYLKRDHATGYLQFYINKEYFSIPKLGKALWKGDIVASDAANNNLLYMQGREKVEGTFHHNDHFDIARLPASWLMGEKDQYLFRANATIALRLKGETQPQNLPDKPWTTLRLSDSDGASVIQSGGTVQVQLPNDTHHVLAKNVWVNGRRQLVYPLGKNFYWMRPYADYVTSAMRDSVMLNPKATALNHVVSLDYDLTGSLYTLLDSIGAEVLRAGGQKQVPNMSVFVGNSDGEILAMSDYNANPIFRVSPNDQRRLQRMRWQSSLFSDFSEDRGLNGNFNLMPLMIGPGSSLKPITFAAVASTVDEDWNQFRLMGSLTTANTEGKYYYVNQYAGKHFNKKNNKDRFRSIKSDEPPFNKERDVAFYLYKSSNYFNSVMVYLGSYSEASLQGGVFTDAHANFSQYGTAEFPIVHNHGRQLRFSHVFDARGADAEPILMKRYSDLFGVYPYSPTSLKNHERNTFMQDYLNNNTLDPGLRATSLHAFALREKGPDKRRFMQPGEGWAVPEASFIDFPLRADPTEISYSAQIKTLTLGMRRIVSVSPLKMGEMFSRVFLLDRNFHFTLSGERKPSRVDFQTPAYSGVGEYLDMLQANRSFYQGLHRCAMVAGNEVVDGQTMNYERGTAYYLSSVRRPGNLHFYAKTGTIDNMNLNQSNLLAVVITNGDMRRAQIRDNQLFIDGQPLKFYVLYIFMDKTLASKFPQASNKKVPLQNGAVQRVVNSQRFRDFFSSTPSAPAPSNGAE